MLDVSDATIGQGVHLLSALSNEDALRIFLYAEQGIRNSTQAIKDLGLTQKRYYSRLKGLIEVGIIEKVEGSYVYTPVGQMLRKIGTSLFGVLENRDKIDVLYNLSQSGALSDDERFKISSMIKENLEIEPLLVSMVDGVDSSNVRKIIEYDELVKHLIEDMTQAEKSVLLASNYIDARVVDAQIKAHRRGVEFKVLMSRESMSSKLNKLKLLLSPNVFLNLLEFSKMTSNDEWFREADISFSFCVVDGYKCYFELPPVGLEFSIAFYLKDEKTSKRFTTFFHKIWEQSGELYKDSLSKLFLESQNTKNGYQLQQQE
jgi:predicted transcriptional regulator